MKKVIFWVSVCILFFLLLILLLPQKHGCFHFYSNYGERICVITLIIFLLVLFFIFVVPVVYKCYESKISSEYFENGKVSDCADTILIRKDVLKKAFIYTDSLRNIPTDCETVIVLRKEIAATDIPIQNAIKQIYITEKETKIEQTAFSSLKSHSVNIYLCNKSSFIIV